MSNFKRKVNIVESTTPPTNQYDWWYDLNSKELKRNTNGGYTSIGVSNQEPPTPTPSGPLLQIGAPENTFYLCFLWDTATISIPVIFGITEVSNWDIHDELVDVDESTWITLNVFSYKGDDTPDLADITGAMNEIKDIIGQSDEALEISDWAVAVVLPESITKIDSEFFQAIPNNPYYSGSTYYLICPNVQCIQGVLLDTTDEYLDLYIGTPSVPEAPEELFSDGMSTYYMTVYIPTELEKDYRNDPIWNQCEELRTLANDITLTTILRPLAGM